MDPDLRRRLRLLCGALGTAILVVVVLVVVGAFRDDPADGASTTEVGGVEVRGVAETAAFLRGLPRSGDTLGDAAAPVTILVVSDLKCPSCRRHALTTQRGIVERFVRTGRANLRLVLVNLRDAARGTTDGEAARRAAYGLAESDGFGGFTQTVLWNQGATEDTWATPPYLRRIASVAPGVDARRSGLRGTATAAARVATADRVARELGTDETPSLYVLRRGALPGERVTAIDDLDALGRAVATATDAPG